ncbi:hypothetical protein AVEN_209541-1, partial [Araneus ventricosus]
MNPGVMCLSLRSSRTIHFDTSVASRLSLFSFAGRHERQYFPKAWKTAIIVPIPKPGKNPQKADSYRPISLLSTISKLTEAIILKRLTAITEKKLVPFQFGFRKKLSTTDQL